MHKRLDKELSSILDEILNKSEKKSKINEEQVKPSFNPGEKWQKRSSVISATKCYVCNHTDSIYCYQIQW
jgi:hypothetical protein